MRTTRADVEAALAVHEPEALRAVLEAAGVRTRGAESARELAKRIADALWWSYATPIGYLSDRVALEDIVDHTARRLGAEACLSRGEVWERLEGLTQILVRQVTDRGVRLDDLDPQVRARLWPDIFPAAAYGTGATGAFGTRWASARVIRFLDGPIGRLLPLLPPLAPWVGAIRTGAGALHLVTGPLGVALAVLSFNEALGARYRRLVPLLLGVGALGPRRVDDADVVG